MLGEAIRAAPKPIGKTINKINDEIGYQFLKRRTRSRTFFNWTLRRPMMHGGNGFNSSKKKRGTERGISTKKAGSKVGFAGMGTGFTPGAILRFLLVLPLPSRVS